jgi:hypothetical protein
MFPLRRMNRAERALNRGNTERAARKFHRLADQLSRRGDLSHSASVRVEAAYAEALGDDAARAVQSTGYALTTLSNMGPQAGEGLRLSLSQVAPAIGRIAHLLRENGHTTEAGQVEQMLAQALQAAGLSAESLATQPAPTTQAHSSLPATCGQCGAPLLPDVVEWHDATTASCPFCGSVVKAI